MSIKRPLPKGAVIGGIAGAGLLVLIIGWMVLVSPQKHKAADLDKQAAAVEQQITDQLAQVAAAKNVVVAPKIRVADVYKLAKAMPSSVDMPNILIELGQVATDSGVDLTTISPATDPSGSVKLTMNVSGNFFTLTDLLYRLRNLVSVRHGELEATGRLFAIDNLSLTPAGKHIEASISMHTYTYVPAAPVAPVATPPAVTGTDTTTTTPSADAPSATGAP